MVVRLHGMPCGLGDSNYCDKGRGRHHLEILDVVRGYRLVNNRLSSGKSWPDFPCLRCFPDEL
jgi:hypothetical protein